MKSNIITHMDSIGNLKKNSSQYLDAYKEWIVKFWVITRLGNNQLYKIKPNSSIKLYDLSKIDAWNWNTQIMFLDISMVRLIFAERNNYIIIFLILINTLKF